MNFKAENPEQLSEAASRLLKVAGDHKIFLFFGDMGAGKTTLIKALCHQLGVTDSVSSPTYSLVNEYPLSKGLIYHFDFYRIKSQEEAFDIGFEEYLYSGNYCFIEWPEQVKDLWPDSFVKVTIEVVSETSRNITAEITN
ncbi:tRNA (adenosine(37)-N6)-threonylcarbamoyltransferase complex ATPase subunit type 1 TsaE [Daejeonella oryzae]|uniref:tRNA (adenosine(37)-N6)-threonylcarbamoyltransferase complex ATPase subunit type 1 TsaE n=1 Tax=Daejeonella oryzae TaxID=1122943 RepID=UPI000418BD33|nr:tRNA (adenosine(37)-N6)-threonylcarbamoyltransferase complex ATPase subunit type 1 TsaE [Daejeonella oryzae]